MRHLSQPPEFPTPTTLLKLRNEAFRGIGQPLTKLCFRPRSPDYWHIPQ